MCDKTDSGERRVLSSMIQHCCSELGYDDPEAKKVSWILERERALSALRNLCNEHGDNDWGNNLSLDDIINKHIYPGYGDE